MTKDIKNFVLNIQHFCAWNEILFVYNNLRLRYRMNISGLRSRKMHLLWLNKLRCSIRLFVSRRLSVTGIPETGRFFRWHNKATGINLFQLIATKVQFTFGDDCRELHTGVLRFPPTVGDGKRRLFPDDCHYGDVADGYKQGRYKHDRCWMKNNVRLKMIKGKHIKPNKF